MSLTEAGALYYERIAQVLDDLEGADAAIAPMQDAPKGLLRVSAPVTVTLTCLSQAIPGFLARYPELSLDLRMEDRRVDIVEEGFDLAIRGSDRLEDSSLIARRLMTMTHVVCGAPGYFARAGVPQSPQDLAAHDCVQFTLSGHANLWPFRKDGRAVEVRIDGRYKASSSLAVRDALVAGFGLSLIPRIYVEKDLAAGRLVSVLDDWTPVATTIYAVYPSRRYLQAKLRAFLDFLIEELTDEPAGG